MAGIETVPMTLSTDMKLQILGPEATFDLLPPTEDVFRQLFFIRFCFFFNFRHFYFSVIYLHKGDQIK